MKYFKLNHITKEEFKKIKEEDVLFITHPGRMGDEDGSTFIVKKDNRFIAYRINGWMYNHDKCEVEYEEVLKSFPKWDEAIKHGENENYIGKYKYYYMGFGNILCVDRRISNIFDKHLEETMIKLAPVYETTLEDYALKYNSWDEAAYETAKELKYDIEYTNEKTLL